MDRNGDGGDTLNTTGLKEKGEAGEDEQEVIEVEEEGKAEEGPDQQQWKEYSGLTSTIVLANQQVERISCQLWAPRKPRNSYM